MPYKNWYFVRYYYVSIVYCYMNIWSKLELRCRRRRRCCRTIEPQTNERTSIQANGKKQAKSIYKYAAKNKQNRCVIFSRLFFVVNNILKIVGVYCVERHTLSVINKIRQFLFFCLLACLLASRLFTTVQSVCSTYCMCADTSRRIWPNAKL